MKVLLVVSIRQLLLDGAEEGSIREARGEEARCERQQQQPTQRRREKPERTQREPKQVVWTLRLRLPVSYFLCVLCVFSASLRWLLLCLRLTLSKIPPQRLNRRQRGECRGFGAQNA